MQTDNWEGLLHTSQPLPHPHLDPLSHQVTSSGTSPCSFFVCFLLPIYLLTHLSSIGSFIQSLVSSSVSQSFSHRVYHLVIQLIMCRTCLLQVAAANDIHNIFSSSSSLPHHPVVAVNQVMIKSTGPLCIRCTLPYLVRSRPARECAKCYQSGKQYLGVHAAVNACKRMLVRDADHAKPHAHVCQHVLTHKFMMCRWAV